MHIYVYMNHMPKPYDDDNNILIIIIRVAHSSYKHLYTYVFSMNTFHESHLKSNFESNVAHEISIHILMCSYLLMYECIQEYSIVTTLPI